MICPVFDVQTFINMYTNLISIHPSQLFQQPNTKPIDHNKFIIIFINIYIYKSHSLLSILKSAGEVC